MTKRDGGQGTARVIRAEVERMRPYVEAVNAAAATGDEIRVWAAQNALREVMVPPMEPVTLDEARRWMLAQYYPAKELRAGVCECGHEGAKDGTAHMGELGHGACLACECERFTWSHWTERRGSVRVTP